LTGFKFSIPACFEVLQYRVPDNYQGLLFAKFLSFYLDLITLSHHQDVDDSNASYSFYQHTYFGMHYLCKTIDFKANSAFCKLNRFQ